MFKIRKNEKIQKLQNKPDILLFIKANDCSGLVLPEKWMVLKKCINGNINRRRPQKRPKTWQIDVVTNILDQRI